MILGLLRPGEKRSTGPGLVPTPTLNLRLGHTSHTLGKTPLVASGPHRLASAFLEINKCSLDCEEGPGPLALFALIGALGMRSCAPLKGLSLRVSSILG